MRYRSIKLFAIAGFLIPLLFSFLPVQETPPDRSQFHDAEELRHFSLLFPDTLLPNAYNELFAASGTCDPCHGYDTAQIASVDLLGNDINVVDDWRATMMANSAKDPFWRAKVSHEGIVNPAHQEALENICTSCHAPMGHYNALHIGQTSYTMADLATDTMGLDGVSCLACHQQRPEGLGDMHSGELNFDTAAIANGPYPGPLVSPMVLESGWTPVYGPHIQDAGTCAGCHTLITETVDLEGEFTGGTFVEQATYHEWLNSSYNDQSISCQSCHMPQLTKSAVYLAAGYETEPRTPFGLHELVGANTMMLQLMRDNAEALGINALPEHFDATIDLTFDILQNQSLELEIELGDLEPDTLSFDLELTNLAGHKFPSGYPARRLFIEFLVQDLESGDTLFASGLTDEEFEVLGHDADFEPHYDQINQEDQVQIYELVMGDVNGNVTTVLERADYPLKDNRLAPLGFTKDDPVYDTTLIAGKALDDVNFNMNEYGEEGSGTDRIQYRIPIDLADDDILVTASVFYQSAPPKWMIEMFNESSPEIDAFRTMFDNADRSPVLIRQVDLTVPGFTATNDATLEHEILAVFPNPSSGATTIESGTDFHLDIFGSDGRLIKKISGQQGSTMLLLDDKGIYILKFRLNNGQLLYRRLIIQ